VGGQFTANGAGGITRLNPDGTLDEDFDPGTGTDEGVGSVAVDPDGRVLIVGDFGAVDGVARNRIARLNADGSLDEDFDPGTGADRPIRSVVVQMSHAIREVGFTAAAPAGTPGPSSTARARIHGLSTRYDHRQRRRCLSCDCVVRQ
jgi:hypothetical protein